MCWGDGSVVEDSAIYQFAPDQEAYVWSQTWGQFWNWNCLFKKNSIWIDKFGNDVCYNKN